MKFLFSLILIVLTWNCQAQIKPYYDDETGKFGYVNRNGELVIPARFGGATAFSEGLASVFIDSAWGYIDTTGSVKIKPQFNSAESFRYNHAAVGVYKRKSQVGKPAEEEVDWCKVHMEPQWTGAYYERRNFNENCVMCPDCFIGIINKEGEFVIESQYKSVWIINNRLFKAGKGDCWGDLGVECYYGLVNNKNENLLKCNFQFSDILYVTDDLRHFVVQDGSEEYPLKGIINKDCDIIIPFKYYHIAFGPVIDKNNPITVGLGNPPEGEGELKFRYVFMNVKQEQVINQSFEHASFFVKGVAEVYTNGKRYCIKQDGILLEYCDECACYR